MSAINQVLEPKLHLALFQPEIPQNTGAAMRLTACMGMPLDIIEPTTFVWDEAKIRRAAMDYIDHVDLRRHQNWVAFRAAYPGQRVLLLTTKASQSYLDFTFKKGDILLAGQESAGAPDFVHASCEARLTIPMHGSVRSMNVVNACSMVIGEALRQIG
ncbi:MAG: tRNA methyltransferase [Micavibrio aeruginosavorus]|uniref:Putative tRNA (cytidine(34)-2'-O)-methyltransferase n=1 Tax=Micavibrio aeruginosavorus TaxID=349221 RepID=A0A2W5N5M7_9BACT|nr:MAG: tRNA methyltransferase [Micavibrio aeruginosavorus]